MEKDGTAPRTNYYLSPSRAGDIHRVPHCSAELRGFDDKIGFPFASLIDCFYLFLFASNPEDLALMSGAQLFMREDIGLTHEQVEVLSGSMNLFMLASILGGDWAADTAPRWSSPTRSAAACVRIGSVPSRLVSCGLFSTCPSPCLVEAGAVPPLVTMSQSSSAHPKLKTKVMVRRRSAMAMRRRRGGPSRPSCPDFNFGKPSQCGLRPEI
jgi:hypothetical protein